MPTAPAPLPVFGADPMARALAQAEQALYLSPPNPRVGCVIVSAQGQLLGQGHTQAVGGPHAEIMALRDAQAAGHNVHGATAYVTLEPCSHHGRTGPCCHALIAAGIGKVVAAVQDPNPRVAGQGFAALRAAGVAVEVGTGAAASRALNIGFFSRMLRQTPWLRMKMAASLDGTTALPNGASQWITSAAARDDGHAWRARACAVLTGIGTVLRDRPQLNVRAVPTPRQPQLVILDSQLRTPMDAPFFASGRTVLLYTAGHSPAQAAPLEAQGATVIALPAAHDTPSAPPRVDLHALLRDLAQREINEVHVEAGHTLNGALLQAGLVDELLLYLAPVLLGPGAGLAQIGPLHALGQGLGLRFEAVDPVGPDLRVRAQFTGRPAW